VAFAVRIFASLAALIPKAKLVPPFGAAPSWLIVSWHHPARADRAAGVVDSHGKPKYALHAFRHFYASWCINRKADGGLELPPKIVEARLGHA
jgi:integrase